MLKEAFWDIFIESGNLEAYSLYKELNVMGESNDKEIVTKEEVAKSS